MSGLHRNILLSRRFNRFISLAVLVTLLMVAVVGVSARPLSVRVDRWLELRNLSGSVESLQNDQWSPARTGLRLNTIGDGLRTGSASLARLAVDTNIGFVSVSENTDIRITALASTSNGGKITQLNVGRGQARLFVRPFTNPDSRFEIQTPAGVNGVRGTEFGIAVQPSGRSAVAVLEGAVASSAQGQSVLVNSGFQSLTVPGESPSPPEPIGDDPAGLTVRRLERVRGRRSGPSLVILQGQTSRFNILSIDKQPQEIDEMGNFDLTLPLPADRRIEVTVTTPLGEIQIYELVVP